MVLNPPAMPGHYDNRLVALSVIIAILASYAALDLANRVTSARGGARRFWLTGGAAAMGLGIWSMHYVGMLAFKLPVPVLYDWPTVLLSLLAAVAASAVALYVVSRKTMGILRLVSASLFMGGGIAGMHYIGMAAMRLPGMCSYSLPLVTLSIVVALVISLVALLLSFRLRDEQHASFGRKAVCAIVMGLAIPLMHYTGMAAATFTFDAAMLQDTSRAIDVSWLGAFVIVAVTFMVLGTTVVAALFDRRLSAQVQFSDLLMESLPGVVCIFDERGNIRRWNHNFLGYAPEEMPGASISRTIAPESLEVTLKAAEKTLQNGAGETETLLLSKSGAKIPCYVTGVRIYYEGQVCVLGIAIDISSRKRAEESVKLQTAALESAANSIVITDVHGRIQWVNPAFTKLTGYRFEEVAGKNPRILKSGEQSGAFYIDMWRTVLSGKTWSGELINRRKDGEFYTEEMTIAPVRSTAGEITNFIAVKQDVSERKMAESDLLRAKEQAEEANRSKSEFVANMSHEIRTPMNGIIGMADLLFETELTAEQSEYLEMVRGSADSLLTIINDILDFSKIEAGKIELEYQPFELRKSLGSVMKTLAIKAHARGLEFIFDIDPAVPVMLIGDAGRIRQVLVNLVGNAVKFTEWGEIQVKVKAEDRGSGGHELFFSVHDTGIGIPPAKQAVIFEAFSQADASTTRKYGGTGLGLTISSCLVNLMGGQLRVESEPGEGSTFHFSIRLKPAPEEVAPESFDLSRLAGEPVLIVDDNATNRRILEDSVRRWRMIPTLADGANAAMQALFELHRSTGAVPMVLTDAHMPDVDGFGLVEKIRQERRFDDAPIVMLTSGGYRGDAARCRELGIAAYVTKPFDRLELRDVLLRVLCGGAAARKTRELITGHTIRERSKSLNVLVAEDNAVNQKLIERLLGKKGHTVTVVQNGREALEMVQQRAFDVVLMDCQMPEMDGLEATARIRQAEKGGNHLPIIALTAHAMQGDRERCLAAGMDAYVSKPVKWEELLSAMESAMVADSRPEALDASVKDS